MYYFGEILGTFLAPLMKPESTLKLWLRVFENLIISRLVKISFFYGGNGGFPKTKTRTFPKTLSHSFNGDSGSIKEAEKVPKISPK